MKEPKERKHSKFSASGADRWQNCAGSVAISEGVEDTSSKWAEEGTRAHEILEALLRIELATCADASQIDELIKFERVLKYTPDLGFTERQHQEMTAHAKNTAKFILNLNKEANPQILVETRISLEFIHPAAFGTFDGAALEFYGILDVVDFKYGAGYPVSPTKNLQMIFYAMALAHKYDWAFETARLWIDQPRVKGYDGPMFWQLSIEELKSWVEVFEDKVLEVELNPDKFVEGPWCRWCKGKKLCPLKKEKRSENTRKVFSTALDISSVDFE
jgi:uncharacterized protein DUF2800